jgi:hypothetical protein
MPRGKDVTRRRSRSLLVVEAAGLIGFYYLVPVDGGSAGNRWLRGGAATVLLGLALWLVVRAVVRQVRAHDDEVELDHLMLAAVAGVVCFALADYVIARADPAQFEGLATKTDALYFTLSTLITVGFGDVHAQAQLARAVVIVQMAFNVVVLATAARTLTRGLSERSRRLRASGPAGDPSDRLLPGDGQRPDDRSVQRNEQQ